MLECPAGAGYCDDVFTAQVVTADVEAEQAGELALVLDEGGHTSRFGAGPSDAAGAPTAATSIWGVIEPGNVFQTHQINLLSDSDSSLVHGTLSSAGRPAGGPPLVSSSI